MIIIKSRPEQIPPVIMQACDRQARENSLADRKERRLSFRASAAVIVLACALLWIGAVSAVLAFL